MKLLNRSRAQRVADAVIRDPKEHTAFDERGAVRSIQAADLTMPEAELDAIWTLMHLERIARTYWKYLSRVTLGLVRVAYTPTERYVVFVARPFVLLRFRAPEYSMDGERGIVRWRIRDGILVASRGREGDGHLEIDLQRCPARRPAAPSCTSRSRSRPSIRRSPSARRAGSTRTPSRASTCSSRTASCARSRTSSWRSPPSGASRSARSPARRERRRRRPQQSADVTVGDTPWPLVGALAARRRDRARAARPAPQPPA